MIRDADFAFHSPSSDRFAKKCLAFFASITFCLGRAWVIDATRDVAPVLDALAASPACYVRDIPVGVVICAASKGDTLQNLSWSRESRGGLEL